MEYYVAIKRRIFCSYNLEDMLVSEINPSHKDKHVNPWLFHFNV